MADFATEFITKLNGKLTPEQMKVVLNELEIFSDDYNIEKKCRDVAVPDDLLPACYKVYMVSKKIEGMSPQSLITYKCYLEQFLYAVGKPVEKITANDIRLYLYGLVGKNSDHTIDTKRIVINTFLDWCCLEYYIPENPCAKIHAIKYEEKPREPLDGIEMEMVRDACVDLRERAMIEFFYSTGCRVSEMAILKKEDIDFSTKEVRLFGKGRKHRVSYLNARAEYTLQKYLATRKYDTDAVFCTIRKPYHALQKQAIEQVIHNIGVRSGIGRPLFPHLIRHTTATNAIDHGMDVTDLQKLLGHTRISTTMIYAKVTQENVRYSHHRYVV